MLNESDYTRDKDGKVVKTNKETILYKKINNAFKTNNL